MRIISRTEFCAMPSGTLYHEVLKSELGLMHPLNCKMSGDDVERNDWTYFSLGDYEILAAAGAPRGMTNPPLGDL